MISIDSGSLNFFAQSASGLAELRQTGLDVGGLIRAELVVPLLGARGAPVVDTRPALQFDLLYDAPSADELMIAAFAPPIANPGILQSATYVATLEAAHASLADLAAQTEDSDRAVFRDALSVLDRARCDRFLLDNACRALMRG
ncbi:hypothetical protein SAMN04488498_1369 [Mesorhizobium albiziae]|uniref:Uncharacterized protein n=1 Tax=Neomesorhizobium albiziae TaxID=335020 RepID=A0A1I4F3C3_9HYPH|nr:hypothetical protein [Mesorhizobium albiziae]GLS30843.1 hypothetical protein GCM10007937_25520 [Mesorhizobium albiziae]SFL12448.1 hypothetical protein SAMN04488498_1369 [Mesorhizobium albiziae]